MRLSFFKKKKAAEALPSVGRGFVPFDRVKDLSSKGFTEPEMIDILRKEGFSAEEIDRALTQALQAGVTAAVEQPEGQLTFPPRHTETTSELPTLEQLQPPKPEMPAVPETSLPEQYYYPEGYSPEEYAEYIVKERMSEVDQRMNELMTKHIELERKISEVKDQIGSITEARPEQQMVVAKMDTFNDTVEDMSIRVNSLEKAFKETLPALIESVRGLTDLIQRMKREA